MNHYETTEIEGRVFNASSVGVPDSFSDAVSKILLESPDYQRLVEFVNKQSEDDKFARLRSYVTCGAWEGEENRIWVNFIFEHKNHIIKDRFDIIAPEEALSSLDEFLRIVEQHNPIS